jgi:hypothetical protein
MGLEKQLRKATALNADPSAVARPAIAVETFELESLDDETAFEIGLIVHAGHHVGELVFLCEVARAMYEQVHHTERRRGANDSNGFDTTREKPGSLDGGEHGQVLPCYRQERARPLGGAYSLKSFKSRQAS